MENPLGADLPDSEVNSAEINALLQARGCGRVGAILAEAGTPTKNGALSLHMLRGLAGRGYLVETPAEDKDQKTIVYFDLARRADLGFLDLAASAAINDLAYKNVALTELTETMQTTSQKTGKLLGEALRDLGKLEAEFGSILVWVAEIKELAGRFRAEDPEAISGDSDRVAGVEAKVELIAAKLTAMMAP